MELNLAEATILQETLLLLLTKSETSPNRHGVVFHEKVRNVKKGPSSCNVDICFENNDDLKLIEYLGDSQCLEDDIQELEGILSGSFPMDSNHDPDTVIGKTAAVTCNVASSTSVEHYVSGLQIVPCAPAVAQLAIKHQPTEQSQHGPAVLDAVIKSSSSSFLQDENQCHSNRVQKLTQGAFSQPSSSHGENIGILDSHSINESGHGSPLDISDCNDPRGTQLNKQMYQSPSRLDPDPKIQSLISMYDRSVERRTRLQARRVRELEVREAEALASCTFSPRVDDHSRQIMSEARSSMRYSSPDFNRDKKLLFPVNLDDGPYMQLLDASASPLNEHTFSFFEENYSPQRQDWAQGTEPPTVARGTAEMFSTVKYSSTVASELQHIPDSSSHRGLQVEAVCGASSYAEDSVQGDIMPAAVPSSMLFNLDSTLHPLSSSSILDPEPHSMDKQPSLTFQQNTDVQLSDNASWEHHQSVTQAGAGQDFGQRLYNIALMRKAKLETCLKQKALEERAARQYRALRAPRALPVLAQPYPPAFRHTPCEKPPLFSPYVTEEGASAPVNNSVKRYITGRSAQQERSVEEFGQHVSPLQAANGKTRNLIVHHHSNLHQEDFRAFDDDRYRDPLLPPPLVASKSSRHHLRTSWDTSQMSNNMISHLVIRPNGVSRIMDYNESQLNKQRDQSGKSAHLRYLPDEGQQLSSSSRAANRGLTSSSSSVLAVSESVMDWSSFLDRQQEFLQCRIQRIELRRHAAERDISSGKPSLSPRSAALARVASARRARRIQSQPLQEGNGVTLSSLSPNRSKAVRPAVLAVPPAGAGAPAGTNRLVSSSSLKADSEGGTNDRFTQNRGGSTLIRQAQQQCDRLGCGEGQVELTFKPKITSMASQMRPSTLEQLMDGGRSNREEMLQTKRFEKEAEAEAELTFRPHLSATARSFPEVKPVVTSLTHPERVIALAEIKQRAAEERRMLEQMEREEREMRECTFRPIITPVPAYLRAGPRNAKHISEYCEARDSATRQYEAFWSHSDQYAYEAIPLPPLDLDSQGSSVHKQDHSQHLHDKKINGRRSTLLDTLQSLVSSGDRGAAAEISIIPAAAVYISADCDPCDTVTASGSTAAAALRISETPQVDADTENLVISEGMSNKAGGLNGGRSHNYAAAAASDDEESLLLINKPAFLSASSHGMEHQQQQWRTSSLSQQISDDDAGDDQVAELVPWDPAASGEKQEGLIIGGESRVLMEDPPTALDVDTVQKAIQLLKMMDEYLASEDVIVASSGRGTGNTNDDHKHTNNVGGSTSISLRQSKENQEEISAA
ncbi:hypothetical protein CEUSTIGMA_g5700.t1 [Chlamydomonas eustigma]|uniref:Uncharacterized protein n=1 Tax=Chlamydomonas eustigma TaxID=1157962 RepID=A0A250X5B6_9CHLO|nr:hypothetical protein CEUSTIGMA_g5700.t1 [Chlamydomonas eustigma]|eukprot:GAX78258.1 hypothetical protein CEUSTIGMA_g5700.t1 [Chlamydomonas eustigma]